ncbi:hypothetical protein WPS_29880 [Vulcanimicrobium alpinum]|uniref:Uncharacterized protein n=1 Tax=Vulcanimicrobium alpinum TaxID=3016050 RepID=A0AAN1XYG1_UNVUL|nr:hypothetical protein [Vulcanimicrobium alpinum]BDE07712.1 hypothetical protein WPS_29880 [Vulcanimicrobium alpinum]
MSGSALAPHLLDAVPAPDSLDDTDAPRASHAIAGDQPAWQRDMLAISSRVRAAIAALNPVVVRVLWFWDHAVRTIALGSRRLDVDPSGSYHLR